MAKGRKPRIINPPQDLKRRALSATQGLNLELTPQELLQIEAVVHQSKDRFVGQIAEKLKALRAMHHEAERNAAVRATYLQMLRDESLAIKGLGGTFGFPLVTTIASSLNDYVRTRADADLRQLLIVRLHIDTIYVLLARGRQPQGLRAETEGELLASFKILTARYA